MRRLFKGRGASGPGMAAAALSPMVDLLTILLVAVLRTYSTDAPVQVSEAGFRLPLSASEAPAGRGVAIDVGAEALYIEGIRSGSVEFWSRTEELLIRDLYEPLQQLGGSKVVIRAHEEAPWGVVGKVLYTVQQAGYADVELVAVSRASL